MSGGASGETERMFRMGLRGWIVGGSDEMEKKNMLMLERPHKCLMDVYSRM